MLCDVCAVIDFSGLILHKLGGNEEGRKHSESHHVSSSALIQAASAGCELCALLLDADDAATEPDETAGDNRMSMHDLGPSELSAQTISYVGYLESSKVQRCYLKHTSVIDESTRWLEITNLADAPGPYISGRKPASDPDPSLWRSWITDCMENHAGCPGSQDVELPTRLLDLGTHPSSQNVRLVETGAFSGQYVALSHVWGRSDLLLTNRDTYSSHKESIASTSLPLTFKDAVMVTRTLGHRYLWIDSLCIIQGNEEDWLRESARMGKVYANAALCIAAAGAKDSTMGLFARHPINTCRSKPFILDQGKHGATSAPILCINPGARTWLDANDVPSTTALAERAWAVQERVLSPRIIGFAAGGRCYFACSRHFRDDTLRDPLQPRQIFQAQGTSMINSVFTNARPEHREDARSCWYKLLAEYTRCSLIEGKDKLPALSAFARMLSGRIGGEYIAGLWCSDAAYSLAWACKGQYPSDLRRSTRPARHQAPSWSWTSCNRPIDFPWQVRVEQPCEECCTWRSPVCSTYDLYMDGRPYRKWLNVWIPCLDFHEADYHLVDYTNPFGEMKSAKLTLSGKLRTISMASPEGPVGDRHFGQSDAPDTDADFHAYFDGERLEPSYDGELRSLLLGCIITDDLGHKVHSMIVQEVSLGSSTFRMVGVTVDEVPQRDNPFPTRPLSGKYQKITLV